MNVDLPEPDGPMTATNSPASMLTVTPRRAWTRRGPNAYSLARSCVSMSVAATLEPQSEASFGGWRRFPSCPR